MDDDIIIESIEDLWDFVDTQTLVINHIIINAKSCQYDGHNINGTQKSTKYPEAAAISCL